VTVPAHCRSCKQRIFWATLVTGGKVPLDLVPTEAGFVVIERGGPARVLRGPELDAVRGAAADRALYTIHRRGCVRPSLAGAGRRW
jgi:hypothetical protein